MKLQVEQAKERVGTNIPFAYAASPLELGDVVAFPWSRHDITVSGEFRYDGTNIVVEGTVRTKGTYECVRCLEETEHKSDISFADAFRPVGEISSDDEEDVHPFDGDVVDLTELIRETLIINEPVQVLCQDDCRGLCSRCGTNLNHDSCECDTFVIDPRLAVLRTLLDNDD